MSLARFNARGLRNRSLHHALRSLSTCAIDKTLKLSAGLEAGVQTIAIQFYGPDKPLRSIIIVPKGQDLVARDDSSAALGRMGIGMSLMKIFDAVLIHKTL